MLYVEVESVVVQSCIITSKRLGNQVCLNELFGLISTQLELEPLA